MTGDVFNPHQQSIDQPGVCTGEPARRAARASRGTRAAHQQALCADLPCVPHEADTRPAVTQVLDTL